MSFVAYCAALQDILPLIDAPRWPPRPTLLTDDFGILKLDFENQQTWGVDEWKKYAQYLEKSGQQLKNDLQKTRRELAIRKEKSSRRNRNSVATNRPIILGGLYDNFKIPKPKRGRKCGSKYAKRIAEIERITIQTGLSAPKIIDNILGSEGLTGWSAEREKELTLKRYYNRRSNPPKK
jgi:hypothetical protein